MNPIVISKKEKKKIKENDIRIQFERFSTLLNAGKTTNFIYEVVDAEFTEAEMRDINAIKTRSKIKDRIEEIKNRGGKFRFLKTEQQIFSNNLTLIDSCLPQILAQIVGKFYSSEYSYLKDLVAEITRENPLNYDMANQHKFYEYKIKRFLTDVALGMMPAKVWTGEYEATGGYLVVKENGDVLCYHIYNRNEFEDYLLSNTKLETASSSRHDFGEIYKQGERVYFKLNLQIRFVK